MKIIFLLLCASALQAQYAIPMSPTNARRYDVHLSYNASGSATTTTGTITTGTASLVVGSASTFFVGQGIFALGCGTVAAGTNPAGNLMTTISAISGTTFTLANNATRSCSGVLVQHDDTVAINTAIADAMNGGGGEVFFATTGTDGTYRCSGIANATTGGVLTFPQRLVYENVPHVALIGEVMGKVAVDGLSLTPGGAGLDFSNAPNVTGNSGLSTAPNVAVLNDGSNYPTVFNSIDVQLKNLVFLMPAQTKLNGIMLRNAMQASGTDHVIAVPKADSAGVYNQPTGGSVGFWPPQQYDNVMVDVSNSEFLYFDTCMVNGEHMRTHLVYLAACNTGLYFYNSYTLTTGDLTMESMPLLMKVDSGATRIPVNLILDVESFGPGWQARGTYDLVDTNQVMTGSINYKIFSSGPGFNSYQNINVNGAGNVNTWNLTSTPNYISGITGCGALTVSSVGKFGSPIFGIITSATTGTCTTVITFTVTAPTGYACQVNNRTNPGSTNLVGQTASSTTTATISGTTISGNILNFECGAY